MLAKLGKMKEAEELELYSRQQVDNAVAKVEKKISQVSFSLNDKIKKVVAKHLEKKEFIGEGEKCPFKTLMEYTVRTNDTTEAELVKFRNTFRKT